MTLLLVHSREQCPYLPPAPQTGKIKVRADNPQRFIVDRQLRQHRTTWFQCRQRNYLAVPNHYPSSHQQRVTMPSNALRPPANLDRLVSSMFEQQMVRNGAQPVAESSIGFLQCDYVSIDLIENLQYALGITTAIGAHTFADIIGRDLDRLHGQSAGPK